MMNCGKWGLHPPFKPLLTRTSSYVLAPEIYAREVITLSAVSCKAISELVPSLSSLDKVFQRTKVRFHFLLLHNKQNTTLKTYHNTNQTDKHVRYDLINSFKLLARNIYANPLRGVRVRKVKRDLVKQIRDGLAGVLAFVFSCHDFF